MHISCIGACPPFPKSAHIFTGSLVPQLADVSAVEVLIQDDMKCPLKYSKVSEKCPPNIKSIGGSDSG